MSQEDVAAVQDIQYQTKTTCDKIKTKDIPKVCFFLVFFFFKEKLTIT